MNVSRTNHEKKKEWEQIKRAEKSCPLRAEQCWKEAVKTSSQLSHSWRLTITEHQLVKEQFEES